MCVLFWVFDNADPFHCLPPVEIKKCKLQTITIVQITVGYRIPNIKVRVACTIQFNFFFHGNPAEETNHQDNWQRLILSTISLFKQHQTTRRLQHHAFSHSQSLPGPVPHTWLPTKLNKKKLNIILISMNKRQTWLAAGWLSLLLLPRLLFCV
jgi:hypothetical protein